MLIIGLILIYLLSVLKMYTYFKNSFSKGGQWSNQDADFMCVVFTFMPIANTVFMLIEIGNDGTDNPNTRFNRLFNVKK